MRLWQSLLALTAFWAALYLPGLGGPELKGEEGRRILPALEMLKSGDWILPVMEGQPYVRKPPLINWAIATSVSAAGTISEFTARLPSALSVLAMALGGAVLLCRFIAGPGATAADQARAAFLIGLMLLVHAGMFSKGRLAEIEALYGALTGIAIALWIHLWREEASPWLTYSLPWFWLGLGLLAKGPPHLFFFYGVVVAVLWKARSLRELWHPAHAAGIVLMLGVFAPWAVAVRGRLAASQTDVKAGATWIDQLTERFSFAQFDAINWLTGPLWALLIILPWGLLLPIYWRRLPQLAGPSGSRDAALADGLRWGVMITAALVLVIPATRPRFVQPLTLPALALCALILWRVAPALWQAWWSRVALGAAALLSIAGVIAPMLVPAIRASTHNALIASLATGGVALAVWRLWVSFRRLRQPIHLALATGLVGLLLSTIYTATVIPAKTPRDDTRPVGARLTQIIGPRQLVIVNPGETPSPLHWRFYLGSPHTVVRRLSEVPAQADFLLVPARLADSPAHRQRLTERLGFSREILRFTDALHNEFALWSREATTAEKDKTPFDGIHIQIISNNWPGFRGTGGIGHAIDAAPPLTWNLDDGTNILWKTAITKHGMSSPVIAGSRLILTAADDVARQVLCYDINSGSLLWHHDADDIPGSPQSGLPTVLQEAGLASPTPAANTRFIAAIFATGELVCVDMNGQRVWAKHLGIPENPYGHASSLISHKNLLIVQYDQKQDSKLLAFDFDSGKPAWEAKRDSISWSSPILIDNHGRTEIILTDSQSVASYDPRSGTLYWRVNCLGGEVASSAAYADGVVFVANEGSKATALDISRHDAEPTVLWHWEGVLPDSSSPVATRDYVVIATAFGNVTCLNAKTGEVHWEHEFDQGFNSSPILVNERVYLIDSSGAMQVFKMDRKFELLGTAELQENAYATPAFVGSRMFIRGLNHIFGIGTENPGEQ
jgi:4-amino-4-deoxy-L-arabinose transferase-like glycosyltransferase/outer membrane protein assembly factor BamB